MGSILNKNSKPKNFGREKYQSKGQRLGWVHKSNYEPMVLCHITSAGEKLNTYTSGPFSTNKLVP